MEQLQQSLKTKSLELAYFDNLKETDHIVQDEQTRRLRLQTIFLEADNDDLHEQLAQGDARMAGLEAQLRNEQAQHTEATENVLRLTEALRAKVREAEALEVSQRCS